MRIYLSYIVQVDDSSAFDKVSSLLNWFNKLLQVGPYYGYFLKPNKCHLIVKEPYFELAKNIFGGTGVNIVTSHRFLGGVIGDPSGQHKFITSTVQESSNHITLLSSIANDQPQVAYSALSKSLQFEWNFLQRVTHNCNHLFQPIEDALLTKFIPSLMGHDCTALERSLFSLPVKLGGLNIKILTANANIAYNSSRSATSLLIDSIKHNSPDFLITDHECLVLESKHNSFIERIEKDHQQLLNILEQADPVQRRSISRHQQSLSCWLNALPVKKDHFDLSAAEFRDALCLRYNKPLLQIPPHCDGCGNLFTTSHALDCKKGGLVVQRHNEIRDLIFDLSSLVWK
jgi:hypothetical protein